MSPALFIYLFICLFQGEALGFSFWRRDEVHLCQVLWVSAASEGKCQGIKTKLQPPNSYYRAPTS